MKYKTLRKVDVISEENYKILLKDLKENQYKLNNFQFMKDFNSTQIYIYFIKL